MRFLAAYEYGFLGNTEYAVKQLDKVLKEAPRDEVAQKLRSEFLARDRKVLPPPAAE